MQGHIYTSPLSVEHNIPTPVYTELRNVHHTSTHATPVVDRNVHHKYLTAYDHYRTEDYVCVTDNSLHNGTNQEEKRNMYKSSRPIPVHYQPPDAIDYTVNEKGVDMPTFRPHKYPSALPDIGSFFGPQQKFHQQEMFTTDKGISAYGSEGALHPVRITPRDMVMSKEGPSFEEVGLPIQYQCIEDINPKLAGRHAKEIIFKNTQTHYGPSNGNKIDTSTKNFYQTYADLRALPASCIRHTDTVKQKYVKVTSGRILMKSGADIYRSRSLTAKPFHCPYCPKSFSQTANLTAHKRIHSGEKPFQCTVCNKKFTQSSSVKTHMRVHTGERPYACNDCGNTFADSSTLTKHKRVHSGDKPYQCRLCSQRFSQSGNLNRHTKVHSLKDRIVSCT